MDLSNRIRSLNRILYIISGFVLLFMVFLTVADTILRYFKKPIVGTYELVGLSAAVVLGFSIPYTTLVKGHVVLDLLTMKFKPGAKKFWLFVTRILGVFLFTFMGYELISMAIDLKRSGEVSATLRLPFYPVAFGIGLCLFLQVLTLIIDAVSAIKEEKK